MEAHGESIQMRVDLDLCAVLRGRCDHSGGALELQPGATVGTVAKKIGLPSETRWIAILNGAIATADSALSEGDHLYIFAPVSGG